MSAVMPTYGRLDLSFVRGEGPYLYTRNGDRYLDFASGIAVNALGHSAPELVTALTEQASKLWHTSNLYHVEGQERFAERLCELTFADLVFMANSGAEANECAIKLTRRYHAVNGNPERYRIITFSGAFHGRTLATISAAGNPKYLDGFGPAVDGFDHVAEFDIDATHAAITEETAGILIEPIQGEGGIRVVPRTFLEQLRELADRHGLLLIFDEVQCGVGRTGKLFAYQWTDIAPDVMAIAKGIGGGFPLGACLATNEAGVGMVAGTHGSTYGGNPLAMAVGNAVLDAVTQPGFLENVQLTSLKLRQKLAQLQDAHPDIIEGIRGEGLMLGLQLKIEPAKLVGAMVSEHLLSVGAAENVVRLLPPLNLDDDQINEAVQALDKACKRLTAEKTA